MKTDNWKIIQLQQKLRYGMIMSVYMIPMQVVLFAILIPALIDHKPLTAQEAGVAAGCILLSYRLVQRIRNVYAILEQLQEKQMAASKFRKP